MLRAAAGGGAVIAGTTFVKFAIAGARPVGVLGRLLGRRQLRGQLRADPAAALDGGDQAAGDDGAGLADKLADVAERRRRVEGFVDEVAHLIRSQVAGIFGNLALVAPLVLAVQLAWQRGVRRAAGRRRRTPSTCCTRSRCSGPTRAVRRLHRRAAVRQLADRRLGRELVRLPPARQRDRLEPAHRRAAGRGARAALGRLVARQHLGPGGQHLARPDAGPGAGAGGLLRLPLEVRHVTLSTGQLAAALGALGSGAAARSRPFWWCVAGIARHRRAEPGVSFLLAFKVALRSRGIRLADRSRIYRGDPRSGCGARRCRSCCRRRSALRRLSARRRRSRRSPPLAAREHGPPDDEHQQQPARPSASSRISHMIDVLGWRAAAAAAAILGGARRLRAPRRAPARRAPRRRAGRAAAPAAAPPARQPIVRAARALGAGRLGRAARLGRRRASRELWPALLRGCDKPAAGWAARLRRGARAAAPADDAAARAWLQQRLQPYRVESLEGAAEGLITGYFEPLVEAQRAAAAARFRVPLYAPAGRPGHAQALLDAPADRHRCRPRRPRCAAASSPTWPTRSTR